MGRPARTLEQCQDYARTRGGECLASEYINEDVKIPWRCDRGHIWPSTAASVVRAKSWCKRCADERSATAKKKTLEDCRLLAAVRGGWCLATECKNNKAALKWLCMCGNDWDTSYNAVHNGTWCSDCADDRKRRKNQFSIETIHKLAARHSGKWISNCYDNVNSVLEWECSEGHTFPMRVCNVIAGSWCDKCGYGLSERLCRAVMEHLFAVKFPRCRPEWLRSAAGARMELDGYNQDLALAFEYQGIQHYKAVLKFKSDSRKLAALQDRDQLKANICASRNVTLLQIPYTVAHDGLEDFIRAGFQQYGKAPAPWKQLPHLDLWQLSVRMDDRLVNVKKEGARKNMECLSKSFLGFKTPLQWRCNACGKESPLSPRWMAKTVSPCKHCRKAAFRDAYRQATLDKVRAFLASRGEQLISVRFTGHNDKLNFRCCQGHEWSTSWASLRHGTSCDNCRAKLLKHPPRKRRAMPGSSS